MPGPSQAVKVSNRCQREDKKVSQHSQLHHHDQCQYMTVITMV